jgi:hypothetical protein
MAREPNTRGNRTHGRYYAEYARATSAEPQDQLQALLDEKNAREWHLVGVAGGLPEGGIIFFWDTERPSFGRSSFSRIER